MNTRKPVDYSAMFVALDMLMAADLPQMELYCEIGWLVSDRAEKGAAVAAAEYLRSAYPDISGFSPRNLRRMREFYRAYESEPEVLAVAMTIGWTQNVVILETDLTSQERAWYIQAVGQFGWSKIKLTRMLKERVHETATLDIADNSWYSRDCGGVKNGEKEIAGTFLQGMWNAEVQREFQRQGPCGPYLQSLFTPLSGTAGRTNDTPPFGKPAAAPPDRKRNDMAEKSNPRSPTCCKISCLHGLCGKVSPLSAKPEEAGTVNPNVGTEHQRRNLRFSWRSGICQRNLSGQPNPASCCPYTAGWHTPDNRAATKNHGEAAEIGSTHTGDLLVEGRFLQPRRCRFGG